MDNRKISSLSTDIIDLLEIELFMDKYNAYEKIAALKTAAATIEHAIQAELMVEAFRKALDT